jgi:hypothetical protein
MTVTADDVVAGTGIAAARTYWPFLVNAMRAEGIDSPSARVAMAATVAHETARKFAPIREYYSGPSREAYFEEKYGYKTSVGQRLGNTVPGYGARFYGRGQIQLTGYYNYLAAEKALGIPLVNNPDLALDPTNSARIAAWYFRTRGVANAADRGDWRAVRKLVNGGYNGWLEFWKFTTGIAARIGLEVRDALVQTGGSLLVILIVGYVLFSATKG